MKRISIKTLITALFITAAVAVPSFSQTCCLSDYQQWFSDTAFAMGVSNIVVQPNATCDTMAASGTYTGNSCLLTGRTINARADLRIIVYAVFNYGPPVGTVYVPMVTDTLNDWCLIVDQENALLSPAVAPLKSFPNPFRSSLSVSFGNPSGKADLEMYDVSGSLVARVNGIRGEQAVLALKGLKQGMYVLKVTTRESVRTLPIIHVK